MDFVEWLNTQSIRAWNVNYCIDDTAGASEILKTLSSEYDWLYLDVLLVKERISKNALYESKELYGYLVKLLTGNDAPKRCHLVRYHDLIEPELLCKGKVILIVDNAHLLHQKTLYLLATDTKYFVEKHQYLQLTPPGDSLCIGYMKHPIEMLTIFIGDTSLTAKMESKDWRDYRWGRPFIWDSSDTHKN
ncbi:hypothetical protein [Floridanema evergladense]|uniref:Uncharacterized protein n=1 Tax=Floridaenema evergladense BLCC-F167 TaxID=3153639 RepID=A0ABV4WU60_9CYAN